MAQDRYDFSAEQALGILYWFDYDISKALSELPKYMPFEGMNVTTRHPMSSTGR